VEHEVPATVGARGLDSPLVRGCGHNTKGPLIPRRISADFTYSFFCKRLTNIAIIYFFKRLEQPLGQGLCLRAIALKKLKRHPLGGTPPNPWEGPEPFNKDF